MRERPRLTSLDLWTAHERRCLQLLRDALALVAREGDGNAETDLNRRLYRAIVRVSHTAARSGDPPPVVVPEGRNPPYFSDRERAEREFKIPDFYWAYIDDLVVDPDAAAKQFVVECKRLTLASKSWNYTAEYVRSGVARFISLGHGYGMGMPSGAMVGYLQKIALNTALDEVNAYARTEKIAPLVIGSRSGDDSAELDHHVTRPYAESPFHLLHFWVRVLSSG
jgi:hypothetical protein